MKKGQAMSLNYVVAAIIALLVLMLIISFATGKFSSVFGATTDVEKEIVSQSKVVAVQSKCSTLCLHAQTMQAPEDSGYCMNDQLEEEGTQRCQDAPFNYECEGVICPDLPPDE